MTSANLKAGLTAVAVRSKPAWKSKTLWCNALGGIVVILTYAIDHHMAQQYSESMGLFMVILNFALRMITNTGLSVSEGQVETVAVDPSTVVKVEPLAQETRPETR